jgi:hypothetical protein
MRNARKEPLTGQTSVGEKVCEAHFEGLTRFFLVMWVSNRKMENYEL